jgi:hypothetical protein
LALIENFRNSLEMAAQVIATQQPLHRLTYSLILLNQIFDPTFSAVGLIDENNSEFVNFYSLRSSQSPGEFKNWILDLSQQTTLNTSLRQGGIVQLQRDGLGSRQLYSFFEAADLQPTSSLLIYPLTVNGRRIGLFAISAPKKNDFHKEVENLLPGFSHFIAQALVNSQTQYVIEEPPEIEPENIVVATGIPAAIIMDKARLQDLEHQLKTLSEHLDVAEKKRRQAEINAAAAQKQARYLAAALRAAEPAVDRANQTSAENKVSQSSNQENGDADNDRMS